MATDIPSNQAPISTDEHVDSRDFRIIGIDLIGADGVFRDISKLVIELQVRQDMYLGFMSGEAIINDGSDMHSQAALHGNEYIYIHITEPEQQISINKAFRVYKVGDRSSAQNNSQRYTIYFVSDEMMTAHLSKISKAYKANTISDIPSDIMKTYLNIPTDHIIIDPTTSPVDVIIPNFRPTEALNWLASRAFDGKDACWFFYENLNGYNFRSINSIYKDGTVINRPFTRFSEASNTSGRRVRYAHWASDRVKDILHAHRTGLAAAWDIPDDAPPEYLRQIDAEVKREMINAKTKQSEFRWVKTRNANHGWDVEAMQIVAALMLKLIPGFEA